MSRVIKGAVAGACTEMTRPKDEGGGGEGRTRTPMNPDRAGVWPELDRVASRSTHDIAARRGTVDVML